jgi:hypothetical protein
MDRANDVVRQGHAVAKKYKTVATLEHNDCRWPIGDPGKADFHFCGAAKLSGHPYCKLHWRLAFHSARPRGVRPILLPPTLDAA